MLGLTEPGVKRKIDLLLFYQAFSRQRSAFSLQLTSVREGFTEG
jgi:hypothetical protein